LKKTVVLFAVNKIYVRFAVYKTSFEGLF